MGVWGAGLYQNDVTLDVRGAYRDGRSLGFSGERLASFVVSMTGDTGGEDGEMASLALADLLWRDGMLNTRRRQAALSLASRPGGVIGFDDPTLKRNHVKALAALATKLVSPQRTAKAAPEPYVEKSDFQIGEALGLPNDKGGWYVLRVVTIYTRLGGRSPVVEVLDWREKQLPDAARVTKLVWRRQHDPIVLGAARQAEALAALIEAGRLPRGAVWADYETQMAAPHIPVIRISDRDPGYRKVVRLGAIVPPTRPFTSDWFIATNAWTRWKNLPSKLAEYFDS